MEQFFQQLRRPRNVAIGLALASPFAYKLIFAKDPDGNPAQAKPWQISVYRLIPLRAASRMWGSFNSITLPEWFRPYGYGMYSKIFGVNLDEMADENLKHYKNLGDFFYRALKNGARTIAPDCLLTSPCDGKILELGQLIDNERIERVKGVSYTAEGLLGAPSPHTSPKSSRESSPAASEMGTPEPEVPTNIMSENLEPVEAPPNPEWLASRNNRLFYCVIYLAPGDYHRFHSPVPWNVCLRRHFVGDLFSVAPYFQSRMMNLFCLNERVALLGNWKYGFFSMTPVGATNVGSIVINFDKALRTNVRGLKSGACFEALYNDTQLSQGEEMGGFRLGSTVVLVFEAPSNFKFSAHSGSTVKMGEPLGDLS